MVPTVEFPPWTPLTSQLTAVLVAFFTVAVNCCFAVTATDALVGDIVIVTAGALVTPSLTVSLVVPPSPLFTTCTGRLVPTCAEVAVPVALSPVDETRVVVIGLPPKYTVEFIPKLEPFSEIVNVPTGTDVGDVLHRCTAGWVTVIVTVPNLVASAVLVA